MNRREKVTLTNMCMIQKNNQVLLLKRKDPVWPGLAFPGGHVKSHESFHDAVVREVQEETGLTIIAPRLVGLKQFYDRDHLRYLVFFYLAQHFHGQMRDSPEGHLIWLKKEELAKQKLAYNFARDLPVFFNKDLSEHLLDGKRDELF